MTKFGELRDQGAMRIAEVTGGVHLLRTRAHADVPTFLYLGIDRMDCAEIRFVVRAPLA